MRTEDLIVDLARQSGPWTPLAPIRVRVARWLLLALALSVMTVAIVGARADLPAALRNPAFVGFAAVLFACGVLAASASIVLGVPGAERTPVSRALSVLLAAGWALAFALRLAAGGNAWTRLAAFPNHWACVAEITGLSIVSGVVLFAMLRRAAPLQLGWSAALATLAAAALAALATQIMCPIDDPAHQLVSHVTPVLLLAAIGTLAGQRALARGHDSVSL